MLDGVLDKFIEEVNEHCEPIREEILNLDRLSCLLLGIGILGTLVVGILLAFLVSLYAFLVLVILYLITLLCVYYRNYIRQ